MLSNSNNSPPYKCRKPNCNDEFEHIEDRDEHEKSVGHFSCDPCGVKFMKPSELNEHYKRMGLSFGYCGLKCLLYKAQKKFTLLLNKSTPMKSDICLDLVCEVCGYDVRNGVPGGRRARILSQFYHCLDHEIRMLIF